MTVQDFSGGVAFPTFGLKDGMSLRDWFAGQALAGFLAAHSGEMPFPPAHGAAEQAYQFADAMLRVRAGET